MTGGSDELAQLVAEVGGAERQLAAAVMRAGRLAGSGVAEAEAGLSLEQVLLLACGLTGADRHTLITAGQLLGHMPWLRTAFETGRVSWGVVRGIVSCAKRLSRDRLGWLDERLAATADQRGLDRLDPDALVDAATEAVAELADLDRLQRQERHGIERSFLSLQPDFFGGIRAYGELHAHLAAPLLDALQAASPPPHAGQAHHHTPHGDGASNTDASTGDGEGDGATGLPAGWSGPSRSRQHATGLWHIATQWLAGTRAGAETADGAEASDEAAGSHPPVTARRARPQLVVRVTLAEATAAVAGHLDLAARGPLPRLTAAAVEALACSGDVQAVVVDGARPLATTPRITATTIPTATRQAIEARDRGCRWPGCRAPLAHTEIHHLLEQSHGGTHHPQNLVSLCRVHHLQAHGRGWTLELEPASGAVTGWRHGRRRWTRLPAATPLAHPDPKAHAARGDGGRSGDPSTQHDPSSPGGTDNAAAKGRHPPEGRDPPDDPPFTDHHGNPLPF